MRKLRRISRKFYQGEFLLYSIECTHFLPSFKALDQEEPISLLYYLETFKGVINRQATKVVDKPFWVQQMSVDDGSLDVVQIGVMLQSTLQKTSFLTELSNMSPVVVSEHLIAKNCICHLKY